MPISKGPTYEILNSHKHLDGTATVTAAQPSAINSCAVLSNPNRQICCTPVLHYILPIRSIQLGTMGVKKKKVFHLYCFL